MRNYVKYPTLFSDMTKIICRNESNTHFVSRFCRIELESNSYSKSYMYACDEDIVYDGKNDVE